MITFEKISEGPTVKENIYRLDFENHTGVEGIELKYAMLEINVSASPGSLFELEPSTQVKIFTPENTAKYTEIKELKLKYEEAENGLRAITREALVLYVAKQIAKSTNAFIFKKRDDGAFFIVYSLLQTEHVCIDGKPVESAYGHVIAYDSEWDNLIKPVRALLKFRMIDKAENIYCQIPENIWQFYKPPPANKKLLECRWDIHINSDLYKQNWIKLIELYESASRKQEKINRLGIMIAQKWLEDRFN